MIYIQCIGIKNVDINNLFNIFHQNIRGLKDKINEFIFSVLSELLHIFCLAEHNLKDYEIDITPITKYKVDVKYCRKILKNGGIGIYYQDSLEITKSNYKITVRNRVLKYVL